MHDLWNTATTEKDGIDASQRVRGAVAGLARSSQIGYGVAYGPDSWALHCRDRYDGYPREQGRQRHVTSGRGAVTERLWVRGVR